VGSKEGGTYTIPVQRTPDALSFDVRPKKAKIWVNELPLANVSETTHLVYDVLGELNTLKIKSDDRFKIIELFHPIIQMVTNSLQKHFSGRPLPLSEKNSRIYNLLQEINTQMAIGYKCVIVNEVNERGKRADTGMITTAIHRNMHYLNTILLHAYQTYASLPVDSWRDIHQLYMFAEQNGLSTTMVKDYMLKHKIKCSIEDLYKHTLLLSLACPYRLHRGEVEQVNGALEEWVNFTRLSKTSGIADANGIFLSQLDLDAPPTYRALHKSSGDVELTRILDTTLLADQLREQMGDSTQNEKIISGNGKLRHNLLNRLALAWGIAPNRTDKRLNISTEVEIAIGMNAIYYHVSGINPDTNQGNLFSSKPLGQTEQSTKQSGIPRTTIPQGMDVVEYEMSNSERDKIFGKLRNDPDPITNNIGEPAPAEESPYPPQPWHMVNVSASGYCLLWNDINASNAKVGELIGVHNKSEGDIQHWGIGVIRWMRNEESSGLKVGVQMLSPNVIPLIVELGEQLATPTGHWLLIPENPASEIDSSLITPAYPLRSGERVMIKQQGKDLYVQLTKMTENTGSFAQYQFLPLPPPKREEKSVLKMTKEPVDDSVWKLI